MASPPERASAASCRLAATCASVRLPFALLRAASRRTTPRSALQPHYFEVLRRQAGRGGGRVVEVGEDTLGPLIHLGTPGAGRHVLALLQFAEQAVHRGGGGDRLLHALDRVGILQAGRLQL